RREQVGPGATRHGAPGRGGRAAPRPPALPRLRAGRLHVGADGRGPARALRAGRPGRGRGTAPRGARRPAGGVAPGRGAPADHPRRRPADDPVGGAGGDRAAGLRGARQPAERDPLFLRPLSRQFPPPRLRLHGLADQADLPPGGGPAPPPEPALSPRRRRRRPHALPLAVGLGLLVALAVVLASPRYRSFYLGPDARVWPPPPAARALTSRAARAARAVASAPPLPQTFGLPLPIGGEPAGLPPAPAETAVAPRGRARGPAPAA